MQFSNDCLYFSFICLTFKVSLNESIVLKEMKRNKYNNKVLNKDFIGNICSHYTLFQSQLQISIDLRLTFILILKWSSFMYEPKLWRFNPSFLLYVYVSKQHKSTHLFNQPFHSIFIRLTLLSNRCHLSFLCHSTISGLSSCFINTHKQFTHKSLCKYSPPPRVLTCLPIFTFYYCF